MNISKLSVVVVLLLSPFLFISVPFANAATSPGLGKANTFSILSSTYTNTVGGTTINGDLGYTTGPATPPTVNGTTHIANSTYNQAGLDQAAVLAILNSQPCTHTFPNGPIDLATDTTHGAIGVYTPGVYCTGAASAASIGAGGITLNGGGTYIFRIDGALTTVANSQVALAGGASSCDIFWTPTGATTLGANSTFFGTNIDAAGITIGSTVTWVGRALAFGGTVSTDTDTITTQACAATPISSSSGSGSNSSRSFSAPSMPGPCISDPVTNTPLIISANRLSPTSVTLSWGPYTGTDTFNVRYGFTNGEWLYNTNVTGFSTTLNDLPGNRPIWVQVASRNNCAIGTYGEPRLVGSPRLPNTGFAPNIMDMTWLLLGYHY